jgi:hypothetical protein
MRKLSDRYQRVDTNTLIERVSGVLNTIDEEYTYRVRRAARASCTNTTHVVEFRLPKINMGGIVPMIYIKNSYGGESSLHIRLGVYRFICDNGLVVGDEFYNERIVHVRGQTLESKLQSLEANIICAVGKIRSELVGHILDMQSRTLYINEQLEIINGLGFPPRVTQECINRRLVPIRAEDADGNVWNLWNTINEVLRERSRSELADYNKQSGLINNIMAMVDSRGGVI